MDLWNIIMAEDKFDDKLERFEKEYILTRTISYDPPEDYIELDMD